MLKYWYLLGCLTVHLLPVLSRKQIGWDLHGPSLDFNALQGYLNVGCSGGGVRIKKPTFVRHLV